MQQSGCLPPLLRLYYTDGFLTWRLVLGYWPAALHPESAPLVGSRWGQPRWSGQLATQVVLVIDKEIMILKSHKTNKFDSGFFKEKACSHVQNTQTHIYGDVPSAEKCAIKSKHAFCMRKVSPKTVTDKMKFFVNPFLSKLSHSHRHTFICHLPTLSGWFLCVSYYQHILILPPWNNSMAGTQTTQQNWASLGI